MSKILIGFDNGYAYIFARDYELFDKEIQAKIGDAKWTGASWRIPEHAVDAARDILMYCYGENDIAIAPDIKVKVKARTGVYENMVLTAWGKVLAKVKDKNSGAVVGENVVLVTGRIYSGGSIKYPTAHAEEGTTFIISGITEAYYREHFDEQNEFFESEIITDLNIKEQKKILLDEKETHQARIAEIDKKLAALGVE